MDNKISIVLTSCIIFVCEYASVLCTIKINHLTMTMQLCLNEAWNAGNQVFEIRIEAKTLFNLDFNSFSVISYIFF